MYHSTVEGWLVRRLPVRRDSEQEWNDCSSNDCDFPMATAVA